MTTSMDVFLPTSLSFHEACFLVQDHRGELVLRFLDREPERFSPAGSAYLRAWIACLQPAPDWHAAGKKEDPEGTYAAETLRAVSCPGFTLYARYLASRSPRRRRPGLWWLLGNLAQAFGEISIECLHESLLHYEKALLLLKERRMMVPWLHAQILCDQATTLSRLGMEVAALGIYQEALDASQHSDTEAEEQAVMREIQIRALAGLCELYGRQASTRQALVCGQRALDLLPAGRTEERAALLLCLGDACAGEQAAIRYQEALELTISPELRCQLWLRLARLALDNAQGARAWVCCACAFQPGLPAFCQADLFLVRATLEAAAGHWESALNCGLLTLRTPQALVPATFLLLGHLLEEMQTRVPDLERTPRWQALYRSALQRVAPALAEPVEPPTWPL